MIMSKYDTMLFGILCFYVYPIDLTTLSTINISSIYIIIMIPIKMIIIKIMIPIKMIMIDAQLHLKASHCAAPPPHHQDLLRSKTAQKVLGDRQ